MMSSVVTEIVMPPICNDPDDAGITHDAPFHAPLAAAHAAAEVGAAVPLNIFPIDAKNAAKLPSVGGAAAPDAAVGGTGPDGELR